MITIREAHSEDLSVCAALRATYTTRDAWQIVAESDLARSTGHMQGMPWLHFRVQQTRLPRTLVLRLPSAVVPLTDVWHSYAARFVAVLDEHPDPLGYLLLQALPDQRQSLIARFVVDPVARGKGIGSALIRAARAWTRMQRFVALLGHAPLRNVPGVQFYQHRGFRISGLSEHFYPTREDALLLVQLV